MLQSLTPQEEIQFELDRRRPGQSRITTPRKESDTCELLSGMAPDGSTTLGTPICVLVRNKDQKSGDYSEMEQAYRPSHAGRGRWGGGSGSSGGGHCGSRAVARRGSGWATH